MKKELLCLCFCGEWEAVSYMYRRFAQKQIAWQCNMLICLGLFRLGRLCLVLYWPTHLRLVLKAHRYLLGRLPPMPWFR